MKAAARKVAIKPRRKKKAPVKVEPGMDWQTILKYGAMLIGAVLGFGKMIADVDYLKKDSTAIKTKVDRVYDHLLWGERGGVGPAPPVRDTESAAPPAGL